MVQINRYLLILLVVVLGILMSFVLGVAGFLLFLSVALNATFLIRLLSLQDEKLDIEYDLQDIYTEVDKFGEHLEKINQMNRYYGDETITNLMTHLRIVQNDLIDFQVKYSTEPVVIIDEQGEEYEYRPEYEENEETEEKDQ